MSMATALLAVITPAGRYVGSGLSGVIRLSASRRKPFDGLAEFHPYPLPPSLRGSATKADLKTQSSEARRLLTCIFGLLNPPNCTRHAA
jgi:hypothetical protein